MEPRRLREVESGRVFGGGGAAGEGGVVLRFSRGSVCGFWLGRFLEPGDGEGILPHVANDEVFIRKAALEP